jgi:hypothetical protein
MATVEVRPQNESVNEYEARRETTLTTAELSECTCPEFCERDHDVD